MEKEVGKKIKEFRSLLNKPIVVTSKFRSKEINEKIRESRTSKLTRSKHLEIRRFNND